MKPNDLLSGGMWFNRKERYFTATLFPALVLGEDMSRLGRLLELLEIPAVSPLWSEDEANTQLFTEYGIAESLPKGKAGPLPAIGRDTPDVVVYQPENFLLGIEAKMFDRPSPAALGEQLARQQKVLDVLRASLDLPEPVLFQALLVPEGMAGSVLLDLLPQDTRLVTWEAVLSAYPDGPRWAVDALKHALDNWNDLVGESKGAGAHTFLTGAQIKLSAESGELGGAVIGRKGGLSGGTFQDDLASGRWQSWPYQVRFEAEPPNSNWFTVREFLAALGPSEEPALKVTWGPIDPSFTHPPASEMAVQVVRSAVEHALAEGVNSISLDALVGAAEDVASDMGIMLSTSDLWIAVYTWAGVDPMSPPPDGTAVRLAP